MNDPIVDEIKKRREDYVKKFNYDFNLIAEDLKKQGYKFIKLQPRLYKKDQAT